MSTDVQLRVFIGRCRLKHTEALNATEHDWLVSEPPNKLHFNSEIVHALDTTPAARRKRNTTHRAYTNTS